eukprot:1628484-Rhodomonas_salina.2
MIIIAGAFAPCQSVCHTPSVEYQLRLVVASEEEHSGESPNFPVAIGSQYRTAHSKQICRYRTSRSECIRG